MNRLESVTKKLTPLEFLQETAEKVTELVDYTKEELYKEHEYIVKELEVIKRKIEGLIKDNIGDMKILPPSIQGKDIVDVINKIYKKLL